MITDTIAAIATARGTGGVGIVRISGENANNIASRFFTGKLLVSHQMVLGKIKSGQNTIDEALGVYFKAPNSYTGEDIVELHCHGGITICSMVLESALANGARAADPGEFTKRAFLNGKLDLSQSEAVCDVINAKTYDAVIVAANQLDGALSKKIAMLREAILGISSHLLASIDFPDEVDEIPYYEFKEKLVGADREISVLLSTADDGRIIKDGVNAAIIGAPNVGKSSFLNAVAGEDRAIVTDIAGTTRDVLEIQVNIRGCKVNLLDTAGIRESGDAVERLGVERSKGAIEKSDIILLMLDGSRELNEYDEEIIRLVGNRNLICLINKADLPQKITPPDFEMDIKLSTKTGEGLDIFFDEISKRYSKGDMVSKVLVTNERHKQSLIHARACMQNALSAMEKHQPADIVVGDLELCIAELGEIDGLTVSDEIIDNIFANFCVGK